MKWAIACTIVIVMIGVAIAPCLNDSMDYVQYERDVAPFDHDNGLAILQATEECILTLLYSDSLHQFSNIDAARAVLYDSYGSQTENLLNMFFDFETKEYNDSGFFFPTIFHEGVELTDSYIRTVRITGRCGSTISTYPELRLVETHVGNDKALTWVRGDDKNVGRFKREVTYRLSDSGQWEINRLGRMNYCIDPELNFTYLALKEGVEVDVIN